MKLNNIVLFIMLSLGNFGFSQSTVVIPNVFTPNYDGVNDVFEIDAKGYEALTCQIYNRLGVSLFRTQRELGWTYPCGCALC